MRDKIQRITREKNDIENERNQYAVDYESLVIEYQNILQQNQELNELRNKERIEYEESMNNTSEVETLIRNFLANNGKGNKDVGKCLKDLIDSYVYLIILYDEK